MKSIDPETGRQALSALLRQRSPLGAMSVMYARLGRLFQIPLRSFRPFVVAGPGSNRQVLVTERHKLRWRNSDPVTDLLDHGVLVTDGAEHDHYRSLMEPALQPAVLSHYTAMMLRQVDRVTALWHDGGRIDMLVEARKIALLIIMDALFGVDAWDDLPRIWTPILKSIAFISPGPWIFWRRLPRPGYKKHLAALDDYLYGIIRSRSQSAPRPDLLQHLMDAGLAPQRIRDQMLTMLIAGHDTSTALLAWTFHLLAAHADLHQRLVHDLDAAIGHEPPASPAGWQPPLLDHVIKESLRLYPPIHAGNRVVTEAICLEGHNIPAGERMFYSIYLTHRDADIWENAERFDPSRFAAGRKTPPFAYVPFGGGPRACIGAAFSQAEARLVLARLLQTWSFESAGVRVRAQMGATLEPRPGVFLKVHKR
jgi:cytochrome P450